MSYFAPYLDDSGLHMPTYEDRLQDLVSAYRSVFGMEAEMDPSMPDYQLLSVFARALDDTSALVLSAYNSRNPAYASGQALDLLLPQYGLSRSPGETDAQARNRLKTALASRAPYLEDALKAALLQVPYLTRAVVRTNDTDSAVDGISPHSIAVVVDNGSSDPIARAIFEKKPPGIATYGTTTRNVTDAHGVTHAVKFSRAGAATIFFLITLKAYAGFDEAAVKAALSPAIRESVGKADIGSDLIVPQFYGLLYQAAGNMASTFAITDLAVSGGGGVERERLSGTWNKYWYLANDDSAIQYTITS